MSLIIMIFFPDMPSCTPTPLTGMSATLYESLKNNMRKPEVLCYYAPAPGNLFVL